MRCLILTAAVLVMGVSASAQQTSGFPPFCVSSQLFLGPANPPCAPGVCANSPVAAEDCQQWGGCGIGSPFHYGTVSMRADRAELSGTQWYHLEPGWQNCGSGLGSGGSASIYATDIVFSGPGSTVAVRLQFDYELVVEWVRTSPEPIPHSLGGGGIRVNHSFGSSYVHYVSVFDGYSGLQTRNDFGHGVQYLGGNSYRASGRYIGPEVMVPTGTPRGFYLQLTIERALGGLDYPGTLTDNNTARVSLPSLGAVFVLPEGFTANSALLGLVDNRLPQPCPSDFNGDGNVDPDDLGDYLNCFFASPPCDRVDFNNDGNVDPDDLGDYINTFFGPSC